MECSLGWQFNCRPDLSVYRMSGWRMGDMLNQAYRPSRHSPSGKNSFFKD